jgi:hypothetical protein
MDRVQTAETHEDRKGPTTMATTRFRRTILAIFALTAPPVFAAEVTIDHIDGLDADANRKALDVAARRLGVCIPFEASERFNRITVVAVYQSGPKEGLRKSGLMTELDESCAFHVLDFEPAVPLATGTVLTVTAHVTSTAEERRKAKVQFAEQLRAYCRTWTEMKQAGWYYEDARDDLLLRYMGLPIGRPNVWATLAHASADDHLAILKGTAKDIGLTFDCRALKKIELRPDDVPSKRPPEPSKNPIIQKYGRPKSDAGH